MNMPDDLYERLRRIAGTDVGDDGVADFALAIIRREVECLERQGDIPHPLPSQDSTNAEIALDETVSNLNADTGLERQELSMAEWQIRRKNRPVLHIDFDAAQAIREDRELRTQQWDSYMESGGKNTS